MNWVTAEGEWCEYGHPARSFYSFTVGWPHVSHQGPCLSAENLFLSAFYLAVSVKSILSLFLEEDEGVDLVQVSCENALRCCCSVVTDGQGTMDTQVTMNRVKSGTRKPL